jgi:hypothetical protein
MTNMNKMMQNRQKEISASLEDAYNSSRDAVADNPLTSTLVAFGTGIAVGVMIGHALSGGRHEVEASTMERLGRQVCGVLRTSLPQSIGRHLHV